MRLHSPAVRALPPGPAPVEYAVAVERYLAGTSLGPASRRIYRISLTSWTWPLVGRRPPQGARRRGAMPPVVPLALLDRAGTGARIAASSSASAALTYLPPANARFTAPTTSSEALLLVM